MPYDVVIVGGGPAGLSAALALGRGRKNVLVCDSGARRNAAAERVYNFVTRDGTPPNEFRALAREQLAAYPSVEVRDARVEAITGTRGAFDVVTAGGVVQSRRILLCTGMIDEMLPIDGFRELWGHAIFQCPYCHGWEVRDKRWGYLATSATSLPFTPLLRGWTRTVTAFVAGPFEIPDEVRETLRGAGITLEARPVTRLVHRDGRLEAVALEDGKMVPCDALFTHTPQRQVDVVRALGVALDDDGSVRVDELTRQTSIPGIYAAGDLTTRVQAAIMSAAAGTRAAAMLNHELTGELAASGLL